MGARQRLDDTPARWPEARPGRQVLVGDGASDVGLAGAIARAESDLAARGIGRVGSDRPAVVALRYADPVRLVTSMFAAWRRGCAVLPLPADAPAERVSGLLRRSGAGWLLSDPPPGASGLRAEFLAAGRRQADAHPVRPLHASDVHLVVATSGSSGGTKGVMLTGHNLAAACAAGNRRSGLDAGDLWLDCLPLHHVGGLMIPLRCLAADAAALMHRRFDAARVWRALNRHPVSHISLVPAMLARLLEAGGGRPPPPTLRHVLVGGGPLSRKVGVDAMQAGWPLCPSWGMTETASQAATFCPSREAWKEGAVGAPLESVELAIGEDGRIRVRGATVMAGYANPGLVPGEGLDESGWFETGDLGRLEADGTLTVLGRADEVLVTGGENVHPAEVERILAACPGVEDVAVTGRPDPVWGHYLASLHVGDVSEATLERWARERLPSAWRPRRFKRVKELPRNAMGKLCRGELAGLPD